MSAKGTFRWPATQGKQDLLEALLPYLRETFALPTASWTLPLPERDDGLLAGEADVE